MLNSLLHTQIFIHVKVDWPSSCESWLTPFLKLVFLFDALICQPESSDTKLNDNVLWSFKLLVAGQLQELCDEMSSHPLTKPSSSLNQATAQKRGHRKKVGHPRRTHRKCTEIQESQESLVGELLPMPPLKALAHATLESRRHCAGLRGWPDDSCAMQHEEKLIGMISYMNITNSNAFSPPAWLAQDSFFLVVISWTSAPCQNERERWDDCQQGEQWWPATTFVWNRLWALECGSGHGHVWGKGIFGSVHGITTGPRLEQLFCYDEHQNGEDDSRNASVCIPGGLQVW